MTSPEISKYEKIITEEKTAHFQEEDKAFFLVSSVMNLGQNSRKMNYEYLD